MVAKWQQFIDGTDGWTTVFCENHDQGRSVSRYASDTLEYRDLSAKLLAMLMCALTGTLFIYQGQEIGMINVPEDWPIGEFKDIESVNFYNSVARETNNDKEELDYVMKSIRILGRDNARLPMQWDSSPFSGFTDRAEGGWMRTHDLYPKINVERQQAEPDSVLNFWKSMIQFRKQHGDLLTHGSFHVYEPENEQTFVFAKKQGRKTAVVALNFTSEDQVVNLPVQDLQLRVGSYLDAAEAEAASSVVAQKRVLRPWEGRLYMTE